jgi:lipid A 4'-phosphatase
VSRGFLLWSIALGLALGILFAAYLSWTSRSPTGSSIMRPASSAFHRLRAEPGAPVRELGTLPSPAATSFCRVRKLVFPNAPMSMAPSVVLFLIGSFLIGPGLTSNLLLKENCGRPRPNSVQQFAGSAPFEPWWRPSDACKRKCSFVSGEASQAFWTIAPASLAPPQVRPLALGGALHGGW